MRATTARFIKIFRPHASKRKYRQGIITDEISEAVPTQYRRTGVAGRRLHRTQKNEIQSQVTRFLEFGSIVARGTAPLEVGTGCRLNQLA